MPSFWKLERRVRDRDRVERGGLARVGTSPASVIVVGDKDAEVALVADAGVVLVGAADRIAVIAPPVASI